MFGGNLVGFLEILESNVVIDNTRVQKLRDKIFIENPLMTSEERSRRLVGQIQKIIKDELAGIDPVYIPKIRNLVLHRSVKNGSILITYSDIIESLAELNLSLEDMLESIKGWYNIHLRGSDVSLIEVIDYIKVLQPLSPVLVEKEDEPSLDPSQELIDITQDNGFEFSKKELSY